MKTLTQAIFRWSFYLILHLSVSIPCLITSYKRSGQKKKRMIGKENVRQVLVGNLHINANLPINLSAKESDWEGFVKRLFDRNTPYKRS